MITALVVDAEDPPLSGTERAAAIDHAQVVLRGLGTAALAHPHATLHLLASGTALAVLRRAAAQLDAKVSFAAPIGEEVIRLRASALVEQGWRARGLPQQLVTVAGAVRQPRVFAASPHTTLRSLVALAQPTTLGWVALFGGEAMERGDTLGHAISTRTLAPRLLLVLPARHALVRRAKAAHQTWLRRAQSACAACAMCEPRCAENIPIAQVLRALSAGGVVRPSTKLVSSAAACTSCGACDLVCPSSLSPSRIVGDLGQRVRAGGVFSARGSRVVAPLDRGLWIARQGLARYDREPPLSVSPVT